MKTLHIIEPAGPSHGPSLAKNIKGLESEGFSVVYQPQAQDPDWTYTSASRPTRSSQLQEALLSTSSWVLAGRGGYGASELLPAIDWEQLKDTSPKTLVGFSDITALQNALYQKLGWVGLHAPMPGSQLWNAQQEDVKELLALLKNNKSQHTLSLSRLAGEHLDIAGFMRGGCFSVLTNLIGTEFFLPSPKDKILFLEDTNETPARLLRFWCQWLQSGYLEHIQAVILGNFSALSEPELYQETKLNLARQMHALSGITILSTECFGHCEINMPIAIGAKAQIHKSETLTWSLP